MTSRATLVFVDLVEDAIINLTPDHFKFGLYNVVTLGTSVCFLGIEKDDLAIPRRSKPLPSTTGTVVST
jgi:hypothetical protein